MTTSTQPEPPALAAATAMFVEVLVVGIGTLAAGTLLLSALIGPAATAKIAPATDSTLIAGTGLAAAYALGILTDRAADAALSPVRRQLRTMSFPADGSYAQARLRLASIPALAAQADYARSRMRICRGWIINTAALTITSDLALLRYSFENQRLLICAISILGLLTTVGFYRAWRTLTATSYRKLAEQTMPADSAASVPGQPQAARP
ncbi:hypothetical protein ABT285_36715 [Streptomyces microflavus]|uniref:hypothetical protein n=1 Tax=Streptomyces microflavus TaxID=1919 RepID=UPI0033325555